MQDQNNFVCRNLPIGLATIAGHRDLITTIELAQVLNVAVIPPFLTRYKSRSWYRKC